MTIKTVSIGYHGKSVWLADRILGEIRKGGYAAGALLPTEHELARRYRVSRPTVRRAVDQLVKHRQLIKLPQRGVQVPNRTHGSATIAQIAFITPALTGETNPYVQGLTEGIDGKKYTLATYSTQANLKQYQEMIEKVIRLRPAGMVVSALPEEVCRIDGSRITESGIPCVTLDAHSIPGLSGDKVTDSAFQNARCIARHIVDRGYRDVAVVTVPPMRTNQEMLRGFRSVFDPAGIPLPDDRVFYFNDPHGYTDPPNPYIDVQCGVAKLLKDEFRCEVFIGGCDYPAVGALRAVLAAGLRVPEDIKILSPMRTAADGATPMKLTTVDVHREEQGRLAGELLMRRIDGFDGQPEVHYVANSLVQGETG